MSAAAECWRHVTLHALRTWLHGDRRGFRTRGHRIHSSGDYMSPPPPKEHEGLRAFHQKRSKAAVQFEPATRGLIGRAIVRQLLEEGRRVLVVAITATHAHILVELPDAMAAIRAIVGRAKNRSSRAVRSTMPGSIWAEGGNYKRVKDRAHQLAVFEYILTKQGSDAWTWHFRQGMPPDEPLEPGKRRRVRKPRKPSSAPPRLAVYSLPKSSMPGEFDFISWIRSQQTPDPRVPLASGDDMAILRWPADDLLLVGVDQVLDGVHFDSAIHSPRSIGRKVMNRNLSDCAAMGCLPVAAVATVALPRGMSLDDAKQLYLGLRDAADPYACRIVGGDTASWAGKLVFTVTLLGSSGGVEPVRRSGAKAGDAIYVTGPLGGSILGRHMTFEPRVRLGRDLASRGVASAMIDLSDGLSRDLGHICNLSGVGAVVDAMAVPIHADVMRLPAGGHTPLEHAMNDGEDYELLFTSATSLGTEAMRIGRIVAERGVWLERDARREPLEPAGWEHGL
jgi:thiamine-monophosphate kinase